MGDVFKRNPNHEKSNESGNDIFLNKNNPPPPLFEPLSTGNSLPEKLELSTSHTTYVLQLKWKLDCYSEECCRSIKTSKKETGEAVALWLEVKHYLSVVNVLFPAEIDRRQVLKILNYNL